MSRAAVVVVQIVLAVLGARGASAQDMAGMQHEQMAKPSGWTFMQDAVVFAMLNDQGSPRGSTEFRAPNWWMGMFDRRLGRGTFTVTTMFSLDPATVTSRGYGEIFQVGETYQGSALVDRQHPHDFLMQAAAIWRAPIGRGVSLTLAGAPVGEPALGPIAYMHRSSASEMPMAPLGHHTLDSTHIAMGVLTAGIDRGPFQVESSIFNAREPDEDRWDLMDPGPLDSWSARVWYRPTPEWTFQISHGYLTKPEALEDGDVRRTTASIGWKRSRGARGEEGHGTGHDTQGTGRGTRGIEETGRGTRGIQGTGRGTRGIRGIEETGRGTRGIRGTDEAHGTEDEWTSITLAWGRNQKVGGLYEEYLGELTRQRRWGTVYWRAEVTQVETDVLRTGVHSAGGRKNGHVVQPGDRDFVGSFTGGATRTFWRPRGWDAAAGGELVGYAVPANLSPFYGSRPWSAQLFIRVRPPAKHRMMDVTMTRHGM